MLKLHKLSYNKERTPKRDHDSDHERKGFTVRDSGLGLEIWGSALKAKGLELTVSTKKC